MTSSRTGLVVVGGLLGLALSTACAPKQVRVAAVTAMSVADLQQVVARGPFSDDPCQAAWFYAVADTRKAGERLDALVAQAPTCPLPIARVRLVQLARTELLSWGAEARASDPATRLELARFAATTRWEPGTSAVADLVADEHPEVRLAAIAAVRALRLSIAAGQLEKSLSAKVPRPVDERALLCTTLTEFNIDAPLAPCRGLNPVEVPTPVVEPRPAPNLCRGLINALVSPNPAATRRALLELARPFVELREGCAVPNELVLRLVQTPPAPEVGSAAAMLLLWVNHPPAMRRAGKWSTQVVAP